MPLIKEEMILPNQYMIDPMESYVRIARVERVYLHSRKALVQFLDGHMEEGVDLEPPVTATVVVGSDFPSTTYAPSAAVYGRGDVVCVVMVRSGEYLIVSPADMNTHLDRENYALIKGWALFDVLNGILVDWADNGAGSYISMWNPTTYVTTTIWGDPEKRTIMRRMLDYFSRLQQTNCDIASIELPWRFDRLGTGPQTNLQQTIHNRRHNGRYVNGFPYVEDDLFATDGTLAADYSMYSSVLTNQFEASVHPAVPMPNRLFYQGGTVIWFGGDEEPDYVLVLCCFPSWALTPYIQFLEVPVSCLAGRKRMERDVDGNIVLSWHNWGDQVRVIWTIPRDYINWTAIANATAKYAELVMRAPRIHIPRVEGANSVTFGLVDGFPYDQDGAVFDVMKVRKIEGSIFRQALPEHAASYPNGSRYQYIVSQSSPVPLDNFYTTRFEFEWLDGTIENPSNQPPGNWERQTFPVPEDPQPPPKQFLCYTDGTNTMHREMVINYYTEGQWDYEVVTDGGMTSWSSGGGGVGGESGLRYVNNHWRHELYRNGNLILTDHFNFIKDRAGDPPTAGGGFYGDNVLNKIVYADVPYNLFVIERVETEIDRFSNYLGPNQYATGRRTRTGLVIFNGVEYVLWVWQKELDTFPGIWNNWPWISDVQAPRQVVEVTGTRPYSVTIDYTGLWMYQPHYDGLDVPLGDYAEIGWNAPTPQFDCGSTNWQYVVDKFKEPRYYWPADHFQVSIDTSTDSFAVRFRCHLVSTGDDDITLAYPNGGDTLLRFNGGTPHFNIPETNENIVL